MDKVGREYHRLQLLTTIVKGLSDSDQSEDAKFVREDLNESLDRCVELRMTSLP